eukprot:g1379.t1
MDVPVLTLPDAIRRNILKVDFSELDVSELEYTSKQIDFFLLDVLRKDPSVTKIVRNIRKTGNAALSELFHKIIGEKYLKDSKMWYRMSGRIKNMVQFHFPSTTLLKPRGPKKSLDSDTYQALKRIKDFKKQNPCDNSVGIPFIEYPPWSVFKEDDAIVKAERDADTYEHRVYKRMKRNATRRMRHEWIPKEWDLVLLSYNTSRPERRRLIKALQKQLSISKPEAKEILHQCDIREEGKLLRADMPDDECEKIKIELEKCGAVCKIEYENWENFDDVSPPE